MSYLFIKEQNENDLILEKNASLIKAEAGVALYLLALFLLFGIFGIFAEYDSVLDFVKSSNLFDTIVVLVVLFFLIKLVLSKYINVEPEYYLFNKSKGIYHNDIPLTYAGDLRYVVVTQHDSFKDDMEDEWRIAFEDQMGSNNFYTLKLVMNSYERYLDISRGKKGLMKLARAISNQLHVTAYLDVLNVDTRMEL